MLKNRDPSSTKTLIIAFAYFTAKMFLVRWMIGAMFKSAGKSL